MIVLMNILQCSPLTLLRTLIRLSMLLDVLPVTVMWWLVTKMRGGYWRRSNREGVGEVVT